ncbi:MAG: ABC transporter substrate-binding protein [Bacillota bacterium]
MNKLKRVLATGLIASLVAAAAGCTPPKQATTGRGGPLSSAKEIVVGAIAPITGDVATFGQSTKQALNLAVQQVNAAGGISGKKVVLKLEDDKNDPVEAANAALKLINQDKVNAIIGSVSSKVTLAAAPLAQKNKIPMISSTSTNEKVTQVGDMIYRACFIDPFQGQVMAKFAKENLKSTTAAVLYDIGNDYSKGLAESFKESFTKGGGQIVAFETYAKGDQDFNAQLTKIKATNPGSLFLPDYYNTVGLIAKQAKAQGITAALLGGDGWDSDDLVKIGGTSVEGTYFSNHYSPDNNSPETKAFIAAYKQAYNAVPDALAALAYDAATVLFDAIKRADSLDGDKIAAAMSQTKDLKTVSGKVNFDTNRNPIKSAVVLSIKDGKQVFVTEVGN